MGKIIPLSKPSLKFFGLWIGLRLEFFEKLRPTTKLELGPSPNLIGLDLIIRGIFCNLVSKYQPYEQMNHFDVVHGTSVSLFSRSTIYMMVFPGPNSPCLIQVDHQTDIYHFDHYRYLGGSLELIYINFIITRTLYRLCWLLQTQLYRIQKQDLPHQEAECMLDFIR